jgi:nitric oxide synthase oxygenase domain/subunit
MGGVREQVRKLADDKFKAISAALPNELIRRCAVLDEKIRAVYNKFKENPYSVADHITFSKNFQQ